MCFLIRLIRLLRVATALLYGSSLQSSLAKPDVVVVDDEDDLLERYLLALLLLFAFLIDVYSLPSNN